MILNENVSYITISILRSIFSETYLLTCGVNHFSTSSEYTVADTIMKRDIKWKCLIHYYFYTSFHLFRNLPPNMLRKPLLHIFRIHGSGHKDGCQEGWPDAVMGEHIWRCQRGCWLGTHKGKYNIKGFYSEKFNFWSQTQTFSYFCCWDSNHW